MDLEGLEFDDLAMQLSMVPENEVRGMKRKADDFEEDDWGLGVAAAGSSEAVTVPVASGSGTTVAAKGGKKPAGGGKGKGKAGGGVEKRAKV